MLCLPNVLCRLGVRKEVKSDVTVDIKVPRGICSTDLQWSRCSVGASARLSLRVGLRPRTSTGSERDGMGLGGSLGERRRGAAHSEAQEKGQISPWGGDVTIREG